MIISRSIVICHLVAITCLWAVWEYRVSTGTKSPINPPPMVGPDVIVGDIPNISRWGTDTDETSFSIGTTSCNIGNAQLAWFSNTSAHPVISQNMFRVKNGRIEQLGMAWLKHGFTALQQSVCGPCTASSSGSWLGVGCSDPYSSSLNGGQSGLGPRSQITASTGDFPMPYGKLVTPYGTMDGRLRVFTADINPALNANSRYFVESQYVSKDDATAGNDNNNASYREVSVTTVTGGWGLGFGSPSSTTVREQPAINAWKAVHADVKLFAVDVPGDGRIIVGMRTTPLPGNTGYHTEFAVENLNSHQSVRSLGVKYGSSTISNPGFHDVDYQFEPYSGTDWTPTIVGSDIVWSTETFAANQNANALRWSTLYSFWCDSELPPRKLTLGMFRTGAVSTMNIDLVQQVIPESFVIRKGMAIGGMFPEVFLSDDVDFKLGLTTKSSPPTIELELKSTSATETPTDFAFRLEAAEVGAPFGNVIQSIKLLNYDTGLYEVIDMRAAETTDLQLDVTPTGDLGRFVQNGTKSVQARIEWVGSQSQVGSRFAWSVDVDQAIWLIGQ